MIAQHPAEILLRRPGLMWGISTLAEAELGGKLLVTRTPGANEWIRARDKLNIGHCLPLASTSIALWQHGAVFWLALFTPQV